MPLYFSIFYNEGGRYPERHEANFALWYAERASLRQEAIVLPDNPVSALDAWASTQTLRAEDVERLREQVWSMIRGVLGHEEPHRPWWSKVQAMVAEVDLRWDAPSQSYVKRGG